MTADAELVLARLRWTREQRIWPNGPRYLWTDAFGVVLLASLHVELGEARFLDEAEALVAEVDRVLGRSVGLRIGEAPDRDGQYFHYLAMWIFALWRLGRFRAGHGERALALARAIHPRFVLPGRARGVEDARGPLGAVPRLRAGRHRSVPRLRGVAPRRRAGARARGLRAVGAWPERVARRSAFFDAHRSGTSYDTDAITHVMACTSRLPGLFLRSPS